MENKRVLNVFTLNCLQTGLRVRVDNFSSGSSWIVSKSPGKVVSHRWRWQHALWDALISRGVPGFESVQWWTLHDLCWEGVPLGNCLWEGVLVLCRSGGDGAKLLVVWMVPGVCGKEAGRWYCHESICNFVEICQVLVFLTGFEGGPHEVVHHCGDGTTLVVGTHPVWGKGSSPAFDAFQFINVFLKVGVSNCPRII